MGSKILYYLIIIPLSVLPYFVLYGISNVMFLLFYYVVGYREKVIVKNIYSAFTDKSEKEKKKLVRKFYLHFTDLIVESIKNFTVSEKQIKKRVLFENIELIDSLYDEGKSIVTVGGHYGNWEMFAVAAGNISKHQQYGIYKPLKNKFFDDKVVSTRGAYGMKLIPMKETKAYFLKENENPISIIFGSDQWPSNPQGAHWTKFLGKRTPFLYGVEKYAKEFNWPVVYCEIVRLKRGRFKIKFHLLTENPVELEKGEMMQLFVGKLEQTINNDPAYWLWSHNRWKQSEEEVFPEKFKGVDE
ncbi:MAG: lysophospholipid acyltransferase family protein [Flavobacteriales bacterium]|nr:lysophospholipid acyltransferase family protein [Flavobacteriales bacterium]